MLALCPSVWNSTMTPFDTDCMHLIQVLDLYAVYFPVKERGIKIRGGHPTAYPFVPLSRMADFLFFWVLACVFDFSSKTMTEPATSQKPPKSGGL